MKQTVTVEPLFAHCTDVACDGHKQEILDVEVEVTEWTFGDWGEDARALANMVEHSVEALRFADADQEPCPHCSNPRQLSRQQRPVYETASGMDPMGLYRLKRLGITWDAQRQASLVQAAAAGSEVRESPSERAARRYVNGDISEADYFRMRAVLDGNGAAAAAIVQDDTNLSRATDEPDPDPPTRADAWTTVEQHIYRRPLKGGGESFVVKFGGKKAGAKTLGEARALKAEWMGEA